MATEREYSFRLTKDDGVPPGTTSSYYEFTRFVSDPALVKGTWITLPSGTRFRRSTSYGKSSLIKHRGNRENSLYKNPVPGRDGHITTSPGGFTNGNDESGNWIFRLSSDLGIPNVFGPPSFPTMETNEAVTKALNKLADAKVNLGENLATLGQTVRLFYNPCKSLYEGLVRMRKDKAVLPYLTKTYQDLIRGGVDRKIASKYLEYVYGFKPLMQDIYSLTESGKKLGNADLLLNARATSFRSLSAPDQHYYNASLTRNEDWKGISGESRTTVSLWARIDPNQKGIRTLNQLGLVNPTSLIWELIPYSFVVDWFIPVGPVLQAFSAPAGLIFVDGSQSRRVSARWSYQNAGVAFQSRPLTVISPATGRMEYEGYNRTRLNSFPLPGIYFDQDPLRLRKDKSDRKYKALAVSIMALPRK